MSKHTPTRTDILPCPFCGKPPEQLGSGRDQTGLMIECITDGCVGPHVSYYDHNKSVAAWNRRAALAQASGQ